MARATTLRRLTASLVVILPFAALLYAPFPALAVPILGSDLATFAVLGAESVTNTGTSTIQGNVGVWAGSSIAGGNAFTSSPGAAVVDATLQVTSGLVHTTTTTGTPNAMAAQGQLDAAILALNNPILVGSPLLLGDGNLTNLSPIAPGNYTVPNLATNISGALVLDGAGDPNALWIFHFPSTTLVASTTSAVTVEDVGSGGGVQVYWDVGTSATLNGPTFAGNVLAGVTITSDGALSMCGRLLAATGSVTLIGDTISIICEGTEYADSYGLSGGLNNTVPEPSTLLLLAPGLIGVAAWLRRARPW